VQQRGNQLGFTRVAVSDYSQISDVLSCECFHLGKLSFFEVSSKVLRPERVES
jgi:hypothetical protein